MGQVEYQYFAWPHILRKKKNVFTLKVVQVQI